MRERAIAWAWERVSRPARSSRSKLAKMLQAELVSSRIISRFRSRSECSKAGKKSE